MSSFAIVTSAPGAAGCAAGRAPNITVNDSKASAALAVVAPNAAIIHFLRMATLPETFVGKIGLHFFDDAATEADWPKSAPAEPPAPGGLFWAARRRLAKGLAAPDKSSSPLSSSFLAIPVRQL
jgi:hypothetical protein